MGMRYSDLPPGAPAYSVDEYVEWWPTEDSDLDVDGCVCSECEQGVGWVTFDTDESTSLGWVPFATIANQDDRIMCEACIAAADDRRI